MGCVFLSFFAAQALLSDWLNSKLRLELEMEDEDMLMCSPETTSPAVQRTVQPAALTYNNFDGTKTSLRILT